MFDIGFIRQNKDFFLDSMKGRAFEIDINELFSLDENSRKIKTELQNLQAKQNELAKKIGMIKIGKSSENIDEIMKNSEEIKNKIPNLQIDSESLDEKLKVILSGIPNILQDDVPIGIDENDNLEIKKIGQKKEFNFTPKEHFEIGEASGLMDFDTATKISGSRFVILKSELARLERAIKNFMLDTHTKKFDYVETYVPHLVNEDAMFGTGQLPKFDNGYKTSDGFYLIPTSEVPLTNIARDSIISEEKLPMRFTAYSQCFRSEAGARGKDTKGMLRQHQFSKVELVSICMPEKSKEEHERMLEAAEYILKALDLHYRVCILCSGDTGFCASKTYDIEVWLPGQGKYREISSCSNTFDFQARRMMARYKTDSGKKGYVHTLNGSGLAVGRTLIAIMENYQNSDGTFEIPDILKKYID